MAKNAKAKQTDEERAALAREQHDPLTVFAELAPIAPPLTLVDDVEGSGFSVHAAPVAGAKLAIATVHTPGVDGAIRSVSYLHLDRSVIIMLAALIPIEEEPGAEVIELHPSLASAVDAATVTGAEHPGVTFEQAGRINTTCAHPECSFRIEQLPGLDEWVHVPNAEGLAPTHPAVPPPPAPERDELDGAVQADA